MNTIAIFSKKADIVLNQIVEKYKLNKYEAIVKIDYISKALALKKINNENASIYLEKELKLDSKISEQILKEIVINIIPLLVITLEENLKDEEVLKQIFGENTKNELGTFNEPTRMPKPIGVTKALKKYIQKKEINAPSQEQTNPLLEKFPFEKKPIKPQETSTTKETEKFQEPIKKSKTGQKKKSDEYREPIE